jgi:hypothetical protein
MTNSLRLLLQHTRQSKPNLFRLIDSQATVMIVGEVAIYSVRPSNRKHLTKRRDC